MNQNKAPCLLKAGYTEERMLGAWNNEPIILKNIWKIKLMSTGQKGHSPDKNGLEKEIYCDKALVQLYYSPSAFFTRTNTDTSSEICKPK